MEAQKAPKAPKAPKAQKAPKAPEIIETNTCGYIKVDKLFIKDVKHLKEEFIKLKENIKAEILKENNINQNLVTKI